MLSIPNRRNAGSLLSRGKYAHDHHKHKILVYIPYPVATIYYPWVWRGGLQWASKLRPVYTDGDVIANSTMRTNKCEIRCIHNAKGWARDSPPVFALPRCVTLPPVTRSRPIRLHPPSARCKSIRHAAERYVYCRCIEKQNAPSPTLRKYRGFQQWRTRAWVGGAMKREIHLWSIFRSVYGLIDERFSSTFDQGEVGFYPRDRMIFNSYEN